MAITIAQFLAGQNDTAIVDTAENLAAASEATFRLFGPRGITSLTSTEGALTLSWQKRVFLMQTGVVVPNSEVLTISLTPDQLEGGVDLVYFGLWDAEFAYSAGRPINMSVERAFSMVQRGIAYTGPEAFSVRGLGSQLAALNAGDLDGLGALAQGVRIDATDDALSLSLAYVRLVAENGMSFSQGDEITVVDTGDAISALTPSELAGLVAQGVDRFDATGAVSLTVEQALAAGLNNSQPGIAFNSGNIVAIVDSSVNIQALDPSDFDFMCQAGVTLFDATDDALTISSEAAVFVQARGGAFAAEDVVTIVVSSIDALSDSFEALAAIGVDIIKSPTGAAGIAVATARSAVAAGLEFASGDEFTLVDTAANIETLSAADIAALAAIGIDGFETNDVPLRLSVAQVFAISAAGMSVGSLSVRDAGTALSALTTTEIEALGVMGVTALDAIGEAYTLTKAQADALDAAAILIGGDDVVTLRLSATELDAMSAGDIAAYEARGFDEIALADSGAAFSALTSSEIAELAAIGVDRLDAAGDVTLSLDQALAIIASGMAFDPGDTVVVADDPELIQALTSAQIQALVALGVDTLGIADGDRLELSLAQALAFADAGFVFDPGFQTVLVNPTVGEVYALTAAQWTALAAAGVDIIAVPDLPQSYAFGSLAAAKAFAATTMSFEDPTIEVSVRVSPAEFSALTEADFLALAGKGFDYIGSTLGTFTVDVEHALAFTGAGLRFVRSEFIAVAGSPDAIEALTRSDFEAFTGANIMFIDIDGGGAVTLTADQVNGIGNFLAFRSGVVTVVDTGENLGGNFVSGALTHGIQRFDATDDVIRIGYSSAVGVAGSPGAAFAAEDVVTVAFHGQTIHFYVNSFAQFAAAGIDIIGTETGTGVVSLATLQAATAAGLALAADDEFTLYDSASIIEGLTVAEIANLASIGIDRLGSSEALRLSMGQLSAVSAAGLSVIGGMLSLLDEGSTLSALTTEEIATLGAMGVRWLDATENAFAITKAQADALKAAGIGSNFQDFVTLRITIGELSATSASDIANFKWVDGFDAIVLAGAPGEATFSIEQMRAIIDAGIVFDAEDLVTVEWGASQWELASLATAGVDLIHVSGTAYELQSLNYLRAMAAAGLRFTDSSDVILLLANRAAYEALTVADFEAAGAAGLRSLAVAGVWASFTAAQIEALIASGLQWNGSGITLTDNEAVTSGLSAEDIERWAAIGLKDITPAHDANGGSTIMTVLAFDTALAMIANSVSMKVDPQGSIIGPAKVTATAAEVLSLTAAQFAGLGTAHIQFLDLDGGAVSLSAARVQQLIGNGISFVADDGLVVLFDAGSAIAEMSAAELASIGATGVDRIDAFGDTSLTVEQALAVVASGIAFNPDDTVAVVDNPANIQALTAEQVLALGTLGVDMLAVPNDQNLYLSPAQLLAIADAGMTFGAGFQTVLNAQAEDVPALTASQWTALAATGLDVVAVGSASFAFGLAAARAFAATALVFDAQYRITIWATPAELSGLTQSDCSAFAAKGFAELKSTADAFTVDAGQALAIAGAGLKFVMSDVITLGTTANALEQLTRSDFDALSDAGVDIIDAGGEAVRLTADQVGGFGPDLSFKPGSVVTVADMGARLGSSLVDNALSHGIRHFDATDDAVTVGLASAFFVFQLGGSFAAEDVVTMVMDSTPIDERAEAFAALAGAGVDIVKTASGEGTVSVATVGAAVAAGLEFAAGDRITLAGTAEAIQSLSGQDFVAFAQAGVDSIELEENLSLGFSQLMSVVAAGLIFNGSAVVTARLTSVELAGLSAATLAGMASSGIDVVASATGNLTLDIATVRAVVEAGLAFAASDTVTLTGTAEEFAGIDGGDYASYKNRGVDFLSVAGTLDIDAAFAAVDAGLTFTDSDIVTVRADGLWNLGAHSFAAMKTAGIDIVEFSSPIALTVANALSAMQAGLTFVSEETIRVDTTDIAQFQSLSPAQYTALGTLGIDILAVPDGWSLYLFLPQVLAIADAGLAFGSGFQVVTQVASANEILAFTAAQWTALDAAGLDVISPFGTVFFDLAGARVFAATAIAIDNHPVVTMTPAELATLTEADMAAFVAKGFLPIRSTTGAFTVDVGLAMSLARAGLPFEQFNTVTLADSAAAIEALTRSDFQALASARVDMIDTGGEAVTLSADQLNGFGSGFTSLRFKWPTPATIADTGANLGGNFVQYALSCLVLYFDATDNAVTVDFASIQTLHGVGGYFAAEDVVTMVTDQGLDANAGFFALFAERVGLDIVKSASGEATVNVGTIRTALFAGFGFAADDEITLVDSGSAIAGLSVEELAALSGLGVDSIKPNDDLSLSFAQFMAIVAGGLTFGGSAALTIRLTSAELAALSASELADMAANGVEVVASITGDFTLDIATIHRVVDAGLALTASDAVTLTGTAQEIAGIDGDYAGYKNWGVDFLHVGSAATFDIDIAFAVIDSQLKFTGSDVIAVEADGLWDLGDYSFAVIKDAGVDIVEFTTSVELTSAEALSAAQSGLTFTSSDGIVVEADTASEIQNLTPAELTAIGTLGVDMLAIPNGQFLSLSLAQILAVANAGMTFGSGFTTLLNDLTWNIEIQTLTGEQWTALAAAGVDIVAVGAGDSFTLGLEAARAFAATTLVFDEEYWVTVSATSAELSGLTEADCSAFAAKGFDFLKSTAGVFTIDADQALAVAGAGLTFATDDVVTLAATAGAIEDLTRADFEAISDAGIDVIDTGGEPVTLTADQVHGFAANLHFEPGSVVTVVDTGANIGGSFVAGATGHRIYHFDATDDAVMVDLESAVFVFQTGGSFAEEDLVTMVIEGEPIDVRANIFSQLAGVGVDIIGTETGEGEVSVATVRAAIAAGLEFAADDQITLVDTPAAIAGLSVGDFAVFAETGVDLIAAAGDLWLSAANALAAAEAGISIDAAVVRDEAAALSALTVEEIEALGAIGVTALDAMGNPYGLSRMQADAIDAAGIALVELDLVTLRLRTDEIDAMNPGDIAAYKDNGFDQVALFDTASAIEALTTSRISDLGGKGVDTVDATDNALTLSLEQFNAYERAGITLAAADMVTLAETGGVLGALTTAQIASLGSKGIDALDAIDNALTLSFEQFNALGLAGMTLAAADVVTLTDTSVALQALTTAQIADLGAQGIDAVDATDDILALNLAQFDACENAGITLAAADVVTLAGTNAALKALTTTQIANLKAKGVDAIDATDNALTLSLAQFNAYGTAGITFAPADVVTLADTGAALKALTTAQIANLKAKGVNALDATDNSLTLTVAQVNALAGMSLAAGDDVTLADTSTALKTVTASGIAGLKAKGIDRLDATDNKASLDYYQAKALAASGLAFATADVVTVTDTGARTAALTVAEIAALRTAGVDAVDTSDNALALKVAQFNAISTAGITLATTDVVTLADTSTALKTVTASGIAGLKAKGIDRLDATDNKASLDYWQAKALATSGAAFATADVVTVTDTGAKTAAFTAAELAALKTAGVDAIDTSDNALALKVAQFNAISTAGITLAAADVVTLADTSTALKTLTASGIAGLKAKGIDKLDATDNKASLDYYQAKALATSGLAFAAADVVTVADTGARTAVLTAAELTALKAAGVDTLDATDNAFTFSLAQFNALGTIRIAATDTVTVNGTTAADTITSNGADLALNGKAGSDTLTGGAGDDTFRFDTALGATNVDRIKTFDVAHDRIEIDNAVFKAFAATGALATAAFHTGTAAADAGDRIIYNKTTGALSYDSDGKGGAAAVTFATLDKGLALSAADFWIV